MQQRRIADETLVKSSRFLLRVLKLALQFSAETA